MIPLGIALIAVGIALVCAGIVLRPRAPRTEPAAPDDTDEFRTILDALGTDDRRDASHESDDTAAMDPSADPAADMIQPGKQRRPQLG